jgi:hypothetical protein
VRHAEDVILLYVTSAPVLSRPVRVVLPAESPFRSLAVSPFRSWLLSP